MTDRRHPGQSRPAHGRQHQQHQGPHGRRRWRRRHGQRRHPHGPRSDRGDGQPGLTQDDHARAPGVQPGAPRGGPEPATGPTIEARGVLELINGQGGFLRSPQRNYRPSPEDIFVPREIVERLQPHPPRQNGAGIEGIEVEGTAVAGGTRHAPHDRRGAPQAAGRLTEIRTINGMTPEVFARRLRFPEMTSIDPVERIRLETTPDEMSTRVIDLLTPIGKGQRCLVVAPPRAGKTTLLQKIAAAISRNHPEIHLIVLLVDERPEEVTDMKRNVRGEVIASSSDELARQHVSVARIVLERSRRLVEAGRDVVILLDSLTRLARAHNAATPGTGRTLSGGLDARTMEQPRRLFGAARKAEEGGSLTVIATALVDTGSRMDDVIFQEFKGTGNMELVLDRALFEQRIYPAVDIPRSGTRKEEKLFPKEDLPRIHRLRRALFEMKPREAMLTLLAKLSKYPTNAAFLKALDG